MYMTSNTILFLIFAMATLSACASKPVPKVKVDGVKKESFYEAVKQPIYSTNLIKKEIPENLRNLKVVYQVPKNCAEYWQELELLNAALGEDLTDRPSGKKDVYTLDLGQMLSDEVESNIPFNSLVKRLSGARKHEKKRLSAKLRGKARRSYLSGWADAMECQKEALHANEYESLEDIEED